MKHIKTTEGLSRASIIIGCIISFLLFIDVLYLVFRDGIYTALLISIFFTAPAILMLLALMMENYENK